MILSSKMAGYSYFGRSPPPILPPQRGHSKKNLSRNLDFFAKKRKKKKKVIFFLEKLSLVPETSAAKKHFKLVFGSGTSDLAKTRPLKI